MSFFEKTTVSFVTKLAIWHQRCVIGVKFKSKSRAFKHYEMSFLPNPSIILLCIKQVQAALPGITIEVRMDNAFFSDTIVGALDKAGIEYTISVPFERFTQFKGQIEQRFRWHALDTACDYFESHWKPKS